MATAIHGLETLAAEYESAMAAEQYHMVASIGPRLVRYVDVAPVDMLNCVGYHGFLYADCAHDARLALMLLQGSHSRAPQGSQLRWKAQHNVAACLLYLGSYDRARDEAQTLLREARSSCYANAGAVRYLIGRSYQYQGNMRDAATAFRQTLSETEKASIRSYAYVGLAGVMARAGDYDGAAEMIDQVRNPDEYRITGHCLGVHAAIALAQGLYQTAIDCGIRGLPLIQGRHMFGSEWQAQVIVLDTLATAAGKLEQYPESECYVALARNLRRRFGGDNL